MMNNNTEASERMIRLLEEARALLLEAHVTGNTMYFGEDDSIMDMIQDSLNEVDQAIAYMKDEE